MKWLYRTELYTSRVTNMNKDGLDEMLQECGNDGWELVNVIPQTDSSYSSFEDKNGNNVDCCYEVRTKSILAVFKKQVM